MRGLTRSALIFFGLLALGASIPSRADVITLTFDTFQDEEAIGDYYDGGSGSMGSGPGPKEGITFSPNALAFNAASDTNFANNPSPTGILYFGSGTGMTMNVAAGFTAGFSFYYSAAYDDSNGSVTVYDGLDRTGDILASIDLVQTPPLGSTPPAFNNWKLVDLSFAGTAKSVYLAGKVDLSSLVAFDNLTLGEGAPPVTIPEPSSLVLAALGCLGFLARRRAAA